MRGIVMAALLAVPQVASAASTIAPCACEEGYSGSDGSCPSGKYAAALQLTGRWRPSDDITYHIATSDADMQVPGPGSSTLDANEVRNAIQQSANTWNNAPCCCSEWDGSGRCLTNADDAVKPAMRLRWDQSVTPVGIPVTDGIEGLEPWDNTTDYKPVNQVIKRIWVAKKNYKTAGSVSIDFDEIPGTLAITLTLPENPQPPDYRILRSRMAINGFQMRWFLGTTVPSSGCEEGCYNLQKTVTHEFGHFIGYSHSKCTASVMVPRSAANDATRLSLHETDVKSLCALRDDSQLSGSGYGVTDACPNTPPQPHKRFFSCTSDAGCSDGLVCFNDGLQRYCDIGCTETSDCPSGEECGGDGAKHCQLVPAKPASGPTGSTANTSPSVDFCAPCETHANCGSGRCVKLSVSDDTGICSINCSTDAECGSAAKCSATREGGEGVCVPNDRSCIATAAAARSQVNESCEGQDSCAPNLICVQLAQAAVCLEECITDPRQPNVNKCSTDGYACYELDKDKKFGACFKATAREGESCLLPDTSICGFTGTFVCAGTAAQSFQDAACYKLCGSTFGNTCSTEQTCLANQGASVGVCTPLPVLTCPLADFGQSCAKSDECASGFCGIRGGSQACSRKCDATLQSGCPKDFTCLSAGEGNTGFCWPGDNIVREAPKCREPADEKKAGCGSCGSSQGGREGAALVLIVALALKRRSRKR
jgi:Matrixin